MRPHTNSKWRLTSRFPYNSTAKSTYLKIEGACVEMQLRILQHNKSNAAPYWLESTREDILLYYERRLIIFRLFRDIILLNLLSKTVAVFVPALYFSGIAFRVDNTGTIRKIMRPCIALSWFRIMRSVFYIQGLVVNNPVHQFSIRYLSTSAMASASWLSR